ncbi:hypothetical protein JCM8547_004729 [Rhodosporidiobolus lusitaniae]
MPQNDSLSVPADKHNKDRSPTPNSMESRRLDIKPKKHRKAHAPLQVVFVGVAVRAREDLEDKGPEYAISVSDGSGTVQSEHGFRDKGTSCDEVLEYVLELAKKYSKQRGHKIQILALSSCCAGLSSEVTFDPPALGKDNKPDFLTRVWLELDSIPFLASKKASEGKFSLDGQATAAVDEALTCLVPMSSSTVKIVLSPLGQVLVDADFRVRLFSLPLVRQITSPALWNTFCRLGSALEAQKTSVAFFSATPRGGGVALMRHALMRIWHATGLNCRWFVPAGDPSNVLQGVAPEDVKLSEDDKKLFEAWTEHNYERLWSGEDSPLKRLDIAVIDDPQLTALIPILRRVSPRTKIVFRSHIQIRADLVDQKKPQITATWEYLWGFIKQADLFVSHPVEEFVPKCVKETMPVVYMPPSTDPVDGLNKPLAREMLHVYRHTFNEAVRSSSGREVDWKRGYILQVARFDPSKGIPDLAEGYRLFREKAEKEMDGKMEHPPQLILTGHSSVDDPDGTLVLHQLHDQLEDDKFKSVRDDIHAIRAPPSDRLLNAMMRGADVACQVSTREGYEIKVSEAVHKGKVVIATKAGGIPLQVREGRDGMLVEPGDAEGIANALLEFYKSDKVKDSKSEMTQNEIEHPVGGRFSDDGDGPSERDLTIGNATMWHLLFSRLMGISGHVELLDEQKELMERLDIKMDGRGGLNMEGLDGKKVWEVLSAGFPEGDKR